MFASALDNNSLSLLVLLHAAQRCMFPLSGEHIETSMPTKTPDYRFAPCCLLSALVHAMPVGGGAWETVTGEGLTGSLNDADFRDRCRTVAAEETGDGIYSVVPPGPKKVLRFVVDSREKTVSIEGFDEPLPLDEFRMMAVRCREDGKIICSMAETLSNQWRACKEQDGCEDHLLDIREMSSAYAGSDQVSELYDHHMYELASNGTDDGLDYLEVVRRMMASVHPHGPVHERFGLHDALPGWTEIANLPNVMQAPVRVAFDTFMSEMLGDYPRERVTMTCVPRGKAQFSEALEDAGYELAGMLEPFDGGNLIPGYKTGDVAFHRAKGVDIVVFNDFIGTYAYAWPTDEGGHFDPSPKSPVIKGFGI